MKDVSSELDNGVKGCNSWMKRPELYCSRDQTQDALEKPTVEKIFTSPPVSLSAVHSQAASLLRSLHLYLCQSVPSQGAGPRTLTYRSLFWSGVHSKLLNCNRMESGHLQRRIQFQFEQ
ncbi:hypothetical protein TNCV_4132011 [Trichonephila clavipes]|nr:hypothetical protein TNCV_4132011 [Trichonephila clavipes]